MTLEEFLRANHPDVLRIYKSWVEHGWELKVGDWIITLEAGFSGYAGKRCQYLGFEEGHDDWKGQHHFGYTDNMETKWLVSPNDMFTMVMPLRKDELHEHEVKAIEEFRSQRKQMRKSLRADHLMSS